MKKVSGEALKQVLASGQDIHGLATEWGLSNGICFNAEHIAGSVMDAEADRARRIEDRLMQQRVGRLF